MFIQISVVQNGPKMKSCFRERQTCIMQLNPAPAIAKCDACILHMLRKRAAGESSPPLERRADSSWPLKMPSPLRRPSPQRPGWLHPSDHDETTFTVTWVDRLGACRSQRRIADGLNGGEVSKTRGCQSGDNFTSGIELGFPVESALGSMSLIRLATPALCINESHEETSTGLKHSVRFLETKLDVVQEA